MKLMQRTQIFACLAMMRGKDWTSVRAIHKTIADAFKGLRAPIPAISTISNVCCCLVNMDFADRLEADLRNHRGNYVSPYEVTYFRLTAEGVASLATTLSVIDKLSDGLDIPKLKKDGGKGHDCIVVPIGIDRPVA